MLFAQSIWWQSISWPPRTLWEAAVSSAIFGLIGVALVILGFKLFDWLTPGKLQEEIIQKNNMAAAVLVGAFIIGLCIVVARAVG